MREFLLAMGWDSTSDAESSNIDTTGWSFGRTDVESVRLSLRELFKRHGIKISQLFEKLDENDDNLLSKAEFTEGLLGPLGFTGDPSVLDDCFLDVDDDGDTVSLRLARCTAGCVDGSRRKSSASPRHARFDFPRSRLVSHGMRIVCAGALNSCLKAAGVQVVDLLGAWDEDSSGHLRKKEWLVQFKRMCADSQDVVWYRQIRDAVTDAFDESIETAKGSCRFRKSRLGSRPRMRRTRRTPPPPRSRSPRTKARAGRCRAAQSGASSTRSNVTASGATRGP